MPGDDYLKLLLGAALTLPLAVLSEFLGGYLLLVVAERRTSAIPQSAGASLRARAPSRLGAWEVALAVPIALALFLVVYRVLTVWALTVGSALSVLLGAVILVVLLAAARDVLWARLRAHRRLRVLNAVFSSAFTALVAGGLFALDRALPHYIALDNPKSVTERSLISGRVTRPDLCVFVLVRPEEGSGSFKYPALPDASGEWKSFVNFQGSNNTRYLLWTVALDRDKCRSADPDSAPAEHVDSLATFRSSQLIVRKQVP